MLHSNEIRISLSLEFAFTNISLKSLRHLLLSRNWPLRTISRSGSPALRLLALPSSRCKSIIFIRSKSLVSLRGCMCMEISGIIVAGGD